MDWKCSRCKFELVEADKASLLRIKDEYNLFGLSENWDYVESELIKICPRCNSQALGLHFKKAIQIRTKSGQIATIHDLPYVKAHKHTEFQSEILKSEICGCFYCLETFTPDIIDDWYGEKCDEYDPLALCPKCGIDSVIGSNSGFPIEFWFLRIMKEFWFSP